MEWDRGGKGCLDGVEKEEVFKEYIFIEFLLESTWRGWQHSRTTKMGVWSYGVEFEGF